jgi:signal transduction histidine kinase
VLAAQLKRGVTDAGSAVADRLAAVRDGMADDNRFREAAVQGAPSERPYLLDYAARAMRLSGLVMLQIQNDSGRILSSGHYRNEYDRLDPDLPAALAAAAGGAALLWARTPAGPMLVLARADSLRLGGQRLVLVGGVEASPPQLGHASSDGELSVSLSVPPAAEGAPIVLGGGRQLDQYGSSLVASFAFPAITMTTNGVRMNSSARFDVTQSLSGIQVLRAAVLWWCLVAAAVAGAAALITANWLAERISRPIRLLAEQSAQIDLSSPTAGFSSDRADEIGALTRVLGAMVRRLRTTAAGLRDAERRAAVGDVARQVTHDVKNGLVPIRHVVRHLTEVQRSQPEQLAAVFAERRPTLDASIAYLADLARTYARLSPPPDASVCDINAVVEAVAAGYATPDPGTRSGTGTPIALQLDPNVPPVAAESLVMRRIIDNLVSNACDAAGSRPGAVTIATRRIGAEVRITVTDRGCGMTPEELRRAFSDFFTTKPNGTGLGLSIVRRLARDVHGTLSVDTAPGSGTQVTLVLPCSDTATGAPRQTRAS